MNKIPYIMTWLYLDDPLLNHDHLVSNHHPEVDDDVREEVGVFLAHQLDETNHELPDLLTPVFLETHHLVEEVVQQNFFRME